MDSMDRTSGGRGADGREDAPEFASRDAAPDRQVTMFNRKAIVVLASIAGMTVMVVSFAFNAPKGSPGSAYEAGSPAELLADDGVRRNYLASPPDTGGTNTMRQASSGSGREAIDSANGLNGLSGGGEASSPIAGDPYGAYAGSPYMAQSWSQDPLSEEAEEPSERELAFQRAMRCGIRSCPAEREGAAPASMPAGSDYIAQWTMPESLPSELESPSTGSSAPAPRDRHEAFLESAGEAESAPYVAAQVQRPISPYQIMAGTLIPVTLVTAINSDLPGEVVAQVTRNVYDTQQRYLLIPAGSRVLGRVDNQVGLGQARVNIAWHRLILPNNNSLALPGFGGVDAQGAAGIRDRVNNHYGRTYVNAMLLSAITAGAQLSQPQAANVYASPSAGQIAAGALGQQMGEVSSEMIRRNMQVGPTLEVRPGFKFSIYVSRDLVLPPYDHYGDS